MEGDKPLAGHCGRLGIALIADEVDGELLVRHEEESDVSPSTTRRSANTGQAPQRHDRHRRGSRRGERVVGEAAAAGHGRDVPVRSATAASRHRTGAYRTGALEPWSRP